MECEACEGKGYRTLNGQDELCIFCFEACDSYELWESLTVSLARSDGHDWASSDVHRRMNLRALYARRVSAVLEVMAKWVQANKEDAQLLTLIGSADSMDEVRRVLAMRGNRGRGPIQSEPNRAGLPHSAGRGGEEDLH